MRVGLCTLEADEHLLSVSSELRQSIAATSEHQICADLFSPPTSEELRNCDYWVILSRVSPDRRQPVTAHSGLHIELYDDRVSELGYMPDSESIGVFWAIMQRDHSFYWAPIGFLEDILRYGHWDFERCDTMANLPDLLRSNMFQHVRWRESDLIEFRGLHGTYWKIGTVGTGGTAVVYRVRDAQGNEYAAKTPSSHRFPGSFALAAGFRREMRLLREISHPNVLRYVDESEPEGENAPHDDPRRMVLICEFAEKGNLYDEIRNRSRLPAFAEVAACTRDVLAGLSALHERGVVHRDLSPKNLLRRRDGSVLIGDLGTARCLEDATITQDHAALGSLIYISAQQFDNAHAATPGDDVFSVGQIMWHFSTGKRPVGNVRKLHDERPDFPIPFLDLVERMRSAEPSTRPGDACEALAMLRHVRDTGDNCGNQRHSGVPSA